MEGGLSVRVLKALREVLHGKISTSLDEMPDTALVAAHISAPTELRKRLCRGSATLGTEVCSGYERPDSRRAKPRRT